MKPRPSLFPGAMPEEKLGVWVGHFPFTGREEPSHFLLEHIPGDSDYLS